jgi:hypothetical protein
VRWLGVLAIKKKLKKNGSSSGLTREVSTRPRLRSKGQLLISRKEDQMNDEI